ncbi:MAG: hypothetical protein J5J00_10115 [Deltaproteobacteria bacterium]|nr:hypothetical protein [Deltaproteobacteria bacterium]
MGVLLLASCRTNVQHRPWGYLRLGKVQSFLKEETHLPDDRLIVRYDGRGLSVMSTSCTYDLTALKPLDGGKVWASEETPSRYDKFGKVLAGPAVADLPYYELKIGEGELDGPADTLYVVIGSERPKDWRLQIPTALATQNNG